MVSPLRGKLDLDKPIKSEESWLVPGTHEEVTILDVDPSDFATLGTLRFTFDKKQKSHRERIFLLNKAEEGVSWKLASIIASVFPGPEVTAYYEWLTEDDWEDALQALRGMQLTVTVAYGPGYRIEFDQDAQAYRAVENDEVICEHEQLDTLERVCKSRNHRKSYRTIAEFTAGEDHITKRNLLALRAALQSRQGVPASEEGVSAAKSARFIRTPSAK